MNLPGVVVLSCVGELAVSGRLALTNARNHKHIRSFAVVNVGLRRNAGRVSFIAGWVAANLDELRPSFGLKMV